MPTGIENALPNGVTSAADSRLVPLIAHVVFRLDVGGLENGLVNLVNRLPENRYRHAIVCITDFTDFARRIHRSDVALHALHKPPGNSICLQHTLWRLFRSLRPSIVHTRNLSALEAQTAAWAARVPVRIHGEHGRDVGDLDGSNRKYQWVRRLHRPFVHHYVTVSQDLASYLSDSIGIDAHRVSQVYNGVDTEKFRPARGRRTELAVFGDRQYFVIGAVGRLQRVKNHTLLVQAFIRALAIMPEARSSLRLVLVGDGPLRNEVAALVEAGGVSDLVWLAGARNDVAGLMQCFDLFVLPSLGEGISNTILESMASGVPVLATRVGGNSELVEAGKNGTLVASGDIEGMANAILSYFREPLRSRREGKAARARVLERFSLDAMVNAYDRLYERCLCSAVARTTTRS